MVNFEILDRIDPERAQLIRDGMCPSCRKVIDREHEFRDVLSVNEFYISGLCQRCQDATFSELDEE